MSKKFNAAVVIGTRPDIIRCSMILNKLRNNENINLNFVYTNQHYDSNLKDVFFDEMEITRPDIILDCGDSTHCSQHSRIISQLEDVFIKDRPDVCLFLGDTNAVIGAIVPWKMRIPICHIEGGMRSYDLDMPEEQNRVIIDRISSAYYVYHNDHKCRLVQEGICPTKIVVVGNTIVDVLMRYSSKVDPLRVCSKYSLPMKKYAIMTLHRDSNMRKDVAACALERVYNWCKAKTMKCIMPVMPRLKNLMGDELKKYDDVFIFTEPLGFFDYISLESGAAIEFTDSGTNQETSTILSVPCVVIRANTERPETFDSGIVAMKDLDIARAADEVFGKYPKKDYSLGDGKASDRIIEDLLSRLDRNFDKDLEPWHNKFIRRNWV